MLYRCLALLLAMVGIALWQIRPLVPEFNVAYAIVACNGGGGVLWMLSSLGYAGARAWENGDDDGRIALLGFMVGVTVLLSMFLAGCSVALGGMSVVSPWLNLLTLLVVATFAVGSYGIEIVFLAQGKRWNK